MPAYCQRRDRSTFWGIFGFHLLFIFCYLPVSLAIYVLSALATVFLWQGPFKPAARLLALSLLFSCLSAAGVWTWFLLTGSASERIATLSFASHLPVLSPAVFYGALLLGVVLVTRRKFPTQGLPFRLGILALLVPVLLMNQQVITGLMISTRDWERYTNYPMLVFACGILASVLTPAAQPRSQTRLNSGGWLATVFVIFLVVIGQGLVYSKWRNANIRTVAHARVLTQSLDGTAHRLLLQEADLAPLLKVRVHPQKPRFVLDYTELFRAPIPPLGSGMGRSRAAKHHKHRLFEFFARTAKTPAQLELLLRQEVQSGAGFYIHFLFSLRDVWHPFTDSRHLKRDEVMEALLEVVSSYRLYLGKEQPEWAFPTLLLSRLEPVELPFSPQWENQFLGKSRLRGENVFLYRQRKRQMRGTSGL